MKRPYAVILLLTICSAVTAQVPNGGSENWSGNVPDNWSANNVAPLSAFVITPNDDARTGAFAARCEVIQDPIFQSRVMSRTMQILGGAPTTSDMPTVMGWYKFGPARSSTSLAIGATVIDVNGAVTGIGTAQIAEAADEYTQFTVPINYDIGPSDPAASVTISFIIADTEPNGAIGSRYLIDDVELDGVQGVRDPVLNSARLGDPFPSPFTTMTTLPLSVSTSTLVKAQVVDLLGRPIKTLANSTFQPGDYPLNWTPKGDLANGIYFVRLTHGGVNEARRVVLQR